MTKKEYIDNLKVPEKDMQNIIEEMRAAEQSHYFDEMFSKEIPKQHYPTKEDLINNISETMKLYKSTFMKIYGYEISEHGFAELALDKLEAVGCTKAREYYSRIISEYEQKSKEELKRAAEWYRKRLESEWEKNIKERTESNADRGKKKFLDGLPQDW